MTTLTRRAFTAAAALTALSAPAAAQTDSATGTQPAHEGPPARTGQTTVNGVTYYHSVAGSGEPLLLLHGGLGSSDMFGPALPRLLPGREVILVDLYGHGRTALTERPFDIPSVADDLAALLDALGYAQVDVLGYSLGGGVGFRLAVQHPQKVRRLAVVSSAFTRDGIYPAMLEMQAAVGAGMADSMKGTPMWDTYMALAPKPEDFPRLLDELGALMRTEYDWRDDLAALEVQTMLVAGDADMVRLEHMVEAFQLLGGGQGDGGWMREGVTRHRLAILPGRTHYELFMAPDLYDLAMPFLNSEEVIPVWGAN